ALRDLLGFRDHEGYLDDERCLLVGPLLRPGFFQEKPDGIQYRWACLLRTDDDFGEALCTDGHYASDLALAILLPCGQAEECAHPRACPACHAFDIGRRLIFHNDGAG